MESESQNFSLTSGFVDILDSAKTCKLQDSLKFFNESFDSRISLMTRDRLTFEILYFLNKISFIKRSFLPAGFSHLSLVGDLNALILNNN